MTRDKAHLIFGRVLNSAHKDLLTKLALEHERELRSALALARAHFSESHPTVYVLIEKVQLATEAVREIMNVPERAAA